MEYDVTLKESALYTVTVQANSENEAYEKAMEAYATGEVCDPDYYDLKPIDIKILTEGK